jgi:hypothetical protein
MRREFSFPFKAKVGGNVVTVTGLHWSGLLETQGHGLVPRNVATLEESPEPGGVRAPWAAVALEPPKQWKRQGCFKSDPLPRRVVKQKAEHTRNWLRATLREPMPAREVLRLAKLDGLNEWSLRRAKRHLKIAAVRTGGIARAGRWLWQFPAS